MMELITEISLCMFAAGILGFIIGWLFSNLLKNEKKETAIRLLQDKYALKHNDLKLLQEELKRKEEDLITKENQLKQCEKQRLAKEMDQEDCEPYITKIDALKSENDMLISQIKEQQLCEEEVEELKIREEHLLAQLASYKEYENNYKSLIMEVESLKNDNEKLHQKALGMQPVATSTTEPILSKTEYENIMHNVLQLKDEAQKIKDEKQQLQDKVTHLEKKLSKKSHQLKICQEKDTLQDKETDDTYIQSKVVSKSQEDFKSDQEICDNKIEGIKEIEVKTLTELIKDTLKEIKK